MLALQKLKGTVALQYHHGIAEVVFVSQILVNHNGKVLGRSKDIIQVNRYLCSKCRYLGQNLSVELIT